MLGGCDASWIRIIFTPARSWNQRAQAQYTLHLCSTDLYIYAQQTSTSMLNRPLHVYATDLYMCTQQTSTTDLYMCTQQTYTCVRNRPIHLYRTYLPSIYRS